MTYTPNVPQANQQISTTQGPILNNFTFLNTSLQVDHNFNALNPFGVQQEGTHVQCSMPNQTADPVALPTGCAGTYYVKDGIPKFYDGTDALEILTAASAFIPFSSNRSVSSFGGTTTQPITINGNNITGNVAGQITVFPSAQITTATPFVVMFYQSGANTRRSIVQAGDNTGPYTYTITYSGGLISISQASTPPQTVNYTYYGWYLPL